MEKILTELGFKSYEVGGIIGLLVFIVAVLIFTIFTLYARRIKSQTNEISLARTQVEAMRAIVEKQLEQMLAECEKTCDKKDLHIERLRDRVQHLERQVEMYQRNEIWFHNEIRNLKDGDEE